MKFPGFVGGSATARSRAFDAQRTVNLYPEVSESGTSKTVAMFVGTPGLAPWATVGSGGIRGMLRFSATLAVVVSGENVYVVDQDGSATLVGPIGLGDGPVSLASNGTLVAIADGAALHFVNPSSRTITTNGVYPADSVSFIDGRFVFNESRTGRFRATLAYSADIDPLDFATAEGSPDDLVSLIVDHREIWLFGSSSTEVYFNAGTDGFPYQRIEGAYIEHGCAAAHSIAKIDSGVFWLGADENGHGIVLRAVGYQPQRLSTHAVEHAIAGYARIDDAVAWTYQQEGHSFYVLTFPTADATWVYDVATNLWHERAWRDNDGRLRRHRGACHMAFAAANIVGDWQTGNLYRLDLDAYTDNGAAIARIRQAPHLAADGKRITHHALEVEMETGVGLVTGQGEDPQAMLQWSDDGGATWSNERWAPIGKIGKRRTRVRFRRLGQARDRVYRLTITDPVKVAIVGATIDAAVGAS